ncbi:hypothetical protein Tco_0269549 [Tanacetum coccineum]
MSLMTRRVSTICAYEYPATIAVSGVPGDGSHVNTHDHDGSEAPDESPDSILSSEPKPLGKHRHPPPPSILSPRESSYPPDKCADKSKITRKQSKNGQARTRESEEYKRVIKS